MPGLEIRAVQWWARRGTPGGHVSSLCFTGRAQGRWLKTLLAISAQIRVHPSWSPRQKVRQSGRRGPWPQRMDVSSLEKKVPVWSLHGFDTLLASGTRSLEAPGTRARPGAQTASWEQHRMELGAHLLLPEGAAAHLCR